MWLYHIDTGTALHALLDVTLLDILHPTVFSIQAMGILVWLLLYVLLLKSRNSCRLSLQLFSKDARQILGTQSLGLKFNQTSLLSCSNCQKIIQSQILKLHWNTMNNTYYTRTYVAEKGLGTCGCFVLHMNSTNFDPIHISIPSSVQSSFMSLV